MKRIIRLTESDLTRLVRRIVKENEENWISQSEDLGSESDFTSMNLKQDKRFRRLVSFFKNHPEIAMDIKKSLERSVNENYKYYDYSGAPKKEITKKHFLNRKLATYGLATIVSAIVGSTIGVMAGEEVLEAALVAAGMGGPLFGALSSEVGREKVTDEPPVDNDETEDIEEPLSERWSQKYKKSIDCNNPKGFSQRAHCQGRKK
jgi:hypothetical protein